MELFFETQSGLSFKIEVDYSDTLLLVKQKIEKSQNIPVSTQVLVVDGVVILREDLNVEQCKIVQESSLQVFFSLEENPNHNNDQLLQLEQSPEPFIPVEEYFEMQDWPVTAEEIRKIYSYRPVMVQTKESKPSSNSVRVNRNIQGPPMNKIAVRVSLPHLGESDTAKIFLFIVNKTDQGAKLRRLICNALGNQSRLRDGKFFLMHKLRILYEDQSFDWNCVGHFSTIEIVPVP